MVHAQSTPVRPHAPMLVMKDGYPIPTTANQRTDLNDLPICELMYARRNEGRVCRATLTAVFDAMRDSSAVVVLYIGADGGQDARVLWPESITLTSEQNIVTRAYCTMRRETKTFRLDRMLTVHALTTPADCEATA